MTGLAEPSNGQGFRVILVMRIDNTIFRDFRASGANLGPNENPFLNRLLDAGHRPTALLGGSGHLLTLSNSGID